MGNNVPIRTRAPRLSASINYDARSAADRNGRQARKCSQAMTPQSAVQAPGVLSWLVGRNER
jgi:hypothetical protein